MIKKIKYIVGNQYVIDNDHPNSGDIILIEVYGDHFCRVKDIESNDEWDTMLNRLTENIDEK